MTCPLKVACLGKMNEVIDDWTRGAPTRRLGCDEALACVAAAAQPTQVFKEGTVKVTRLSTRHFYRISPARGDEGAAMASQASQLDP